MAKGKSGGVRKGKKGLLFVKIDKRNSKAFKGKAKSIGGYNVIDKSQLTEKQRRIVNRKMADLESGGKMQARNDFFGALNLTGKRKASKEEGLVGGRRKFNLHRMEKIRRYYTDEEAAWVRMHNKVKRAVNKKLREQKAAMVDPKSISMSQFTLDGRRMPSEKVFVENFLRKHGIKYKSLTAAEKNAMVIKHVEKLIRDNMWDAGEIHNSNSVRNQYLKKEGGVMHAPTKKAGQSMVFSHHLFKLIGKKNIIDKTTGDVYRTKSGDVDFPKILKAWNLKANKHLLAQRAYRDRQKALRQATRESMRPKPNANATKQIQRLIRLCEDKLSQKARFAIYKTMQEVQSASMEKIKEFVAWNNLTGNAITGLMSLITYPRASKHQGKYHIEQVPGLRYKRATRPMISAGHYDWNNPVYGGYYVGRLYDYRNTYFHIPASSVDFMTTSGHYAYYDAKKMLDNLYQHIEGSGLKNPNDVVISFVSGAEYITTLKTRGGVDLLQQASMFARIEIINRLNRYIKQSK